MGISADLIIFDGTGADELEDYMESLTFHEFLPTSLHHLILPSQVEMYDLGYYQKKYKDPDLSIKVVYPTGAVHFSNGQSTRRPKTIMQDCSVIKSRTIMYIGGSGSFVDEIYTHYRNKPDYPYLWPISDMNMLVDDRETRKRIRNAIKGLDKESIYINLNY